MNLEKLFELVLNDPDNISIQYSNINGKEKLVVNGEDIINQDETFDDSKIKEKIANYKDNIEKLDDYIFEKIINEAENRGYNLSEMSRILDLDNLTRTDALKADFTINTMSDLIQTIIKEEILNLVETLETF